MRNDNGVVSTESINSWMVGNPEIIQKRSFGEVKD